MTSDNKLTALQQQFASPRFADILRLHTASDVITLRDGVPGDYAVARGAAEALYSRLRELFTQRRAIRAGAYSPTQAVSMRSTGLNAIYLDDGRDRQAAALRAGLTEPELSNASLGRLGDEAAAVVRALIVADHAQRAERAAMTEATRRSVFEVDYTPFVLASTSTAGAGAERVRDAVRRFVEAGVPAVYLDDHRRGPQGEPVFVPAGEYIAELTAARLQLDVMGVPGIVVARTHLGPTAFLDDPGDARDQPFILGATNLCVPAFAEAWPATQQHFDAVRNRHRSGRPSSARDDFDDTAASAWLESSGIARIIEQAASSPSETDDAVAALLARVFQQFVAIWQRDAELKTFGEAVAALMRWPIQDCRELPMAPAHWREFAKHASLDDMRARAESMGLEPTWDCDHAKTTDGRLQIRAGVDYAIARLLPAAPHADVLWLDASHADLDAARAFAQAIHAKFPERLLAYSASSATEPALAAADAAQLAALGYVLQ